EVGRVSNDEPNAGAVDASNVGNIQHNVRELANYLFERAIEGLQLIAENNSPSALQDEHVATKALFDLKGHRVLWRWMPRYHKELKPDVGGAQPASHELSS